MRYEIYDAIGIGAWRTQCTPCSAKLVMTLQTEILSTETSDFLNNKKKKKKKRKESKNFESLNSVLYIALFSRSYLQHLVLLPEKHS